MDFEDIISLIFVLILAVLSKKKKRMPEEESSDEPDITEVRRRIEALKRQRMDSQHSPARTLPNVTPASIKRNFSAYKHLPKTPKPAENILPEAMNRPSVNVSATYKPANNVGKNIANGRTKLHEWIIGQVVLDTPAFRKNYGNFFYR